jgi:hypothetical protein
MAIASKKSDMFAGKKSFDREIEPPLATHLLMVVDVKAQVWFKPTVGFLFLNVVGPKHYKFGVRSGKLLRKSEGNLWRLLHG